MKQIEPVIEPGFIHPGNGDPFYEMTVVDVQAFMHLFPLISAVPHAVADIPHLTQNDMIYAARYGQGYLV